MVCVKEQEDLGEKLSQDEIISQTKQVIQGLEALKQEHHSILEGLLGTLRCLKQDEEGVLVEEKSHMIRKSLEMLELGLSEAQVGGGAAAGWESEELPQGSWLGRPPFVGTQQPASELLMSWERNSASSCEEQLLPTEGISSAFQMQMFRRRFSSV